MINRIEAKEKNNKLKNFHILIIITGIIFVFLPIFHTGLWFDESFSVAIANHSFAEIWTIGGHDVHPVLYYWILHILNLIFGNNILVYRIFSAVCISILGIVGYTHIRKDFGEKVGLLFSFFTLFLPVNVIYAGEIRMYGLAMLLVTLTAIYAHRIYVSHKFKVKNWILFTMFSLMSAYTHYYGLMAVGLINLFLMIHFIKKDVKIKKIDENLKAFIIAAITQFALYIPWVIYMVLQMNKVSDNFWIYIKFPDTFIEMFTFQFVGNLIQNKYISNIIAGIYGILITSYAIYLSTKAKSKRDVGKLAITLYGLVILAACIMSLIISRPIIYARYLLCVTGMFIFFISYMAGKYGYKYINIGICIFTIIISIFINSKLIKINYDPSNKKPFEYIASQIQPDDLILYGNEGSGFVVSTNFPENKSYFLDEKDWKTEEEFKAFGKDMQTIYNLDILEDYHGRIWIIGAADYVLLDKVTHEYDINVIDKQFYNTEYKKFQYTISLVEKK